MVTLSNDKGLIGTLWSTLSICAMLEAWFRRSERTLTWWIPCRDHRVATNSAYVQLRAPKKMWIVIPMFWVSYRPLEGSSTLRKWCPAMLRTFAAKALPGLPLSWLKNSPESPTVRQLCPGRFSKFAWASFEVFWGGKMMASCVANVCLGFLWAYLSTSQNLKH